MLSELAVVLSFDFVSLVVAVLLARWTLRRTPSGGEARRLVNAAARASEAFLWREAKYTAIGTFLCMAVVVAMHGVFVLRKAPGHGLEVALWTAFATAIGAVTTSSIAYVTAQMGLHTSLRTLRAAHLNLEQGMSVAVRGAGVAALVAEGLGAAAVATLFGLEYLLRGGTVAGSAQAAALLARAGAALPGLCLGSVAAASVFGLGGSSYHACAEVGGLSASGLDTTDPRNPSMVADLVGAHVGIGVRRAIDMVTATTLANVTMVLVGIAAFSADTGAADSHAWALVTLPLVVRAVGVVASALGLVTARSTEAERASVALWRGQVTSSVLVLGGLLGAAFWLVGNHGFQWLAAAGALGVGTGAVAAQLARLRVNRRQPAVHEIVESAKAGSAVAIARGLASGLEGVMLPIAALGLLLFSAFQLGQRCGVSSGGLLGMMTALSAFVATSPYMLAVGLFGPIVGGATTVAALDPEAAESDAKRRCSLLDDAGFEGGAAAQAFFILLGCAAALAAGLSILLSRGVSGPATTALAAVPASLCCGLLGSMLIAGLCGRTLSAATRAARSTVLEVERQLRGFPREAGVAAIPETYTPSYRTVVDLASKVSLRGTIAPPLIGVAVPAALGFALRLLYTSPGLAAEGLTSFVVLASATGLGIALANAGSRGALGAAHRVTRLRGGAADAEAVLAGQALGTFFGDITAPAAHLYVTATATMALVIAPLLSAP